MLTRRYRKGRYQSVKPASNPVRSVPSIESKCRQASTCIRHLASGPRNKNNQARHVRHRRHRCTRTLHTEVVKAKMFNLLNYKQKTPFQNDKTLCKTSKLIQLPEALQGHDARPIPRTEARE